MQDKASASGGVGTAAGLGYQYLVTVRDILDRMVEHPEEDFILESEDHVSDAVDYSITDSGGVRLISVQAKSSVDGPEGPNLGTPEIMRILLRMIKHDARRYAVRTNRKLTTAGNELCAAISSLDPSATTSAEVIEAIRPHVDSTVLAQATNLKEDLPRLARCAVNCEPVDLDFLRSQIMGKTRDLRRLRGDGTGQRAAEVLVGYLTSQILHLSSRRTDRRLNRADIEALIGTTTLTLASAAGKIDWGVPIGPAPTTPSVDRPGTLNAIVSTLHGPPTDTVRRIALTGLSGIGKSAMARLFLDTARHYYDRILWIDAHSKESIRHAASTYVEIDTNDVSTDIVAERFKATLSCAPATWILIFDNAPDSRTVTPWLPVVGAIDIIVTSTNSTGWSQWHHSTLQPMTDAEALALVKERLNIDRDDADARKTAQKLCQAMENWPLAIELACASLADSEHGIAMTDVYLERLRKHIVDDETLVPPEYLSHPSLLQAVTVALATVASRDDHLPMRAMALLDTLAYLPPRSTPLQLACRITAAAESMAGRYQIGGDDALERDAAVEHDGDIAIRQLSTASLTRRTSVSGVPWEDAIRTNEIILDIVRIGHSPTTRTAILALLQIVLNDKFMSALDDYRFSTAGTLLASAWTTIGFSEEYGVFTLDGITLIGNLAAMLEHRGELHGALSLYRRELTIIDEMDRDAPALPAKIHSSSSALLLKVNAPLGEIRRSIDAALFYLGRCAIDAETVGSTAVAAMQVYETVQLLASNASFDPETTDAWISYLVEHYPDAGALSPVREFNDQLRSSDGASATVAAIERQIMVEDNPVTRLQLLFLRGDALASLEHYNESVEAMQEACVQADARGIGLDAGWTAVLNAWRTATFRALDLGDANALEFCRQMDTLVGERRASQDDDCATLELCRVAARILDRPLHETTARLERLAARTIAPTHLTPHPAGVQLAVSTCQRIARLRHSAEGAPIIPFQTCGRGQAPTSRGLQPVVVMALDRTHVEGMPSSLAGRWVLNEWGASLAIEGDSPVLLASPATFSACWMEDEGAMADSPSMRLREVITSQEFAAYRNTVLLCSLYEGMGPSIIDPNGPTVEVAIRA